MTMVKDIGEYLQSLFPKEIEYGRNLHYQDMPHDSDYQHGILLKQIPSSEPTYIVWKGESVRLQVDVWYGTGGKHRDEAEETSYMIYDALHKLTRKTMNSGLFYPSILATGAPYDTSPDLRGRFKFTTVYNIVKEY